MRSPGAIVIGGDYRGLGVARSLGRHGIPVWVVRSGDDHALAGMSRFSRRSLVWPDGEEVRTAFLLELCDRHGLDGWALFPTWDETAAFIARNRAVLGRRYLPTTPPWDVLRWAYDKRLTHQLATSLGVDQPRTWLPRARSEVERFPGPFPVILKPSLKPDLNPLAVAKAWRVDDRAGLLARYDEAVALVEPGTLMLQEFIPGGSEEQLSFAALCDKGVPRAWMTARRLRQYPMDFGRSSSFVETIGHSEVEEPARAILAMLRLTGLVEVEFKRDPRDGGSKLLDINARVWGWHTIGRRAGLDFPYLLWRLLHGLPVPRFSAPAGMRWLRLTTDVPAALPEILARRLSTAAYLRSLAPPHERAILAGDDPLPGLLEVPLFAYKTARAWVKAAAQ
jgi:D-aspartate ligase